MDLEKRTVRKVTWRLVPFLILCYFVAYLDRVNVSFAKLAMDADLGISETAFAVGSGVFFIAYFAFEVPSNLFLERFGARKWIARIMFSWGVLSAFTAVAVGPWSFGFLRTLLGFAEAGFFPGIIFYLTLWFPAKERARIIGLFMAAIPLSSVIGSPLSGWLLGLSGTLGLAGWQWLYILEAIPALVLSVVVFYYLTDTPANALWLRPDERAWLVDRLARERQIKSASREYGVGDALVDPRVWAVAMIYFGLVAANYGYSFFLPTIIKAFGLSNVQTGFVVAVPYLIGAVTMVIYGRHSDARKERKLHAAVALLVAAAGILGSTFTSDPLLKMVAFTVAGMGIFSALPVVWTLPTAYLSGAAAAGGIAVVNAVGNLSGFAGPFAMGFIKDQTGSFDGGLWVLTGSALFAMVIVLLLRHDPKLEEALSGRDLAVEAD